MLHHERWTAPKRVIFNLSVLINRSFLSLDGTTICGSVLRTPRSRAIIKYGFTPIVSAEELFGSTPQLLLLLLLLLFLPTYLILIPSQ
ncbi:hypothetical protein BDV26DRAFT_252247 [Aspergillus bertholletiae]|uniref:Uncharacterized protein n=1 Tax=Aspergillus bertholletiae TaxID=1226010 RepID=A0A5N7BMA8_9EURO|nr:hypothetical protein BDV26DRAFT_252247 [Aspergillus bertholletiae]